MKKKCRRAFLFCLAMLAFFMVPYGFAGKLDYRSRGGRKPPSNRQVGTLCIAYGCALLWASLAGKDDDDKQ